jgi:hypothetical protein
VDSVTFFASIGFPIWIFAADSCSLDKYEIPIKSEESHRFSKTSSIHGGSRLYSTLVMLLKWYWNTFTIYFNR